MQLFIFFHFNELNSLRVLQTFHHKLHSHGERFCTVDSNADAFVNLIIDLLNHHFFPLLTSFLYPPVILELKN